MFLVCVWDQETRTATVTLCSIHSRSQLSRQKPKLSVVMVSPFTLLSLCLFEFAHIIHYRIPFFLVRKKKKTVMHGPSAQRRGLV